MTLKEIQDELLALAARSVTLANELGKVLGDIKKVESVSASWKDFKRGDRIRVTFVDGSVVEDAVGMIEHTSYNGALPIFLRGKCEWIAVEEGTAEWITSDRRFTKLEKLV